MRRKAETTPDVRVSRDGRAVCVTTVHVSRTQEHKPCDTHCETHTGDASRGSDTQGHRRVANARASSPDDGRRQTLQSQEETVVENPRKATKPQIREHNKLSGQGEESRGRKTAGGTETDMTHYSAETGVRTGWASLPPVLETAVHGAYHAQCKYLSKTNVKDVSEPPKSDRSAAAQALQEADGKPPPEDRARSPAYARQRLAPRNTKHRIDS